MKKILAALLLFAAGSAFGGDWYSVQAGYDKGSTRLTFNRHFQAKHVAELLGYYISLHPEAGISAWHGPHGNAVQVSLVPMLRTYVSFDTFLELGVGVSYFTSTDFGRRDISTRFQFADHIGLGWRMGQERILGIRLSHFSNASIKKPNPGVNSLQLTYGVRF